MSGILTAIVRWLTVAVLVLLAAYFNALVILGQPWDWAAAKPLFMLAASTTSMAVWAFLSALRRI